jgi:hypothetical protein
MGASAAALELGASELGTNIAMRPLLPLIGSAVEAAAPFAAPVAGGAACIFCAVNLGQRIYQGPVTGTFGNIPFAYQGQRAISNIGGIANLGPTTFFFNNTRGWANPTTATNGSPTGNPAPSPSPSPFARPNPFGNPNPSPTATPEPNSCPCLVRFGMPETAQDLRNQANAAQNNGFPYGVSTKLVTKISGSDRFNRWAPLSQVQSTFPGTRQTGERLTHFTVVFPRTVDQDIANIFNTVFTHH